MQHVTIAPALDLCTGTGWMSIIDAWLKAVWNAIFVCHLNTWPPRGSSEPHTFSPDPVPYPLDLMHPNSITIGNYFEILNQYLANMMDSCLKHLSHTFYTYHTI